MNTQLKSRPTVDTLPQRHVSRPQPVWTDLKTPGSDPTPNHKRTWAIIAAVAVLAGAIVAGVALLGDASTDTPTPAFSTERPAFDSPGGNSLTIPPIVQSPAPNTTAQRPAFDSPGGNSLTIPPIVQSPAPNTTAQRPAFDSPGGNSLNTRPLVDVNPPTRTTEVSRSALLDGAAFEAAIAGAVAEVEAPRSALLDGARFQAAIHDALTAVDD